MNEPMPRILTEEETHKMDADVLKYIRRVTELPLGFDERTKIKAFYGGVIICHPEQEPLVFGHDGEIKPLKAFETKEKNP